MVLPTFADQALLGEPITVYGTGEQSRCFVHVQDSVEAVLKLLKEPAAVGEVFNIGSDREVTMNRLAHMSRDAADSSSPIVHVPYEEAYAEGFEDMLRRVPDVSKLQAVTGTHPSIPLEKIVADVIAHRRTALALDG
jgi:UDP-glucose 4-epimerase